MVSEVMRGDAGGVSTGLSAAPPSAPKSSAQARATLVTAWALVLLASGLPQALGRELLGQPVTAD